MDALSDGLLEHKPVEHRGKCQNFASIFQAQTQLSVVCQEMS